MKIKHVLYFLVLVFFLSLFSQLYASTSINGSDENEANGKKIPIVAYKRTSNGTIEPLTESQLFLQFDPPVKKAYKIQTDRTATFVISSQFAKSQVRAYLIRGGSIVAGCFSAFTPTQAKKVILKGIDCLY